MSGWEKRYLQASFRGVNFFVNSASTKGGRRNVKHIFPKNDTIEHEDLGRQEVDFTLDAYLLGDDYFDQRTKFENALNQPGIGVLIHPYRGTLNVVVNSFDANETTEKGRFISYSINFSLQEIIRATVSAPSLKWRLSDTKEKLKEKVTSNFIDIYSLVGKPAKAVADARTTLDKGLSFITSAKKIVASMADFQRQVENTRGRLIALSLNAEFLADEIIDLTSFGTDFSTGVTFGVDSTNARDQYREQKEIREFLNSLEGTNSEDRSYPAYQIKQLISLSAIISQCTILGAIEFETINDAKETQDDFLKSLEYFLKDSNTSDDLYAQIEDTRVNIFEALQDKYINLPELIYYKPEIKTNTLKLSYSLYGNLDNEQDIIDRNLIVHPGFVTSETIEVKL